jgi:hypothetical protein
MHDDLLERRLGAALHAEADALPFTITAAEVERRMGLRRRSFASRRLTLLLAAAIGISLFGIGGALSGLREPKPEPTAPAVVNVAPWPATTAGRLPSLDELVAIDPETVLEAQAHGPADGPGHDLSRGEFPPNVHFGLFPSGSRVSVGCLGPTTLALNLDGNATSIPCDGTAHHETLQGSERVGVGLGSTSSTDASWRLVVRGNWGPMTMRLVPDVFDSGAPHHLDEFVRLDDVTVDDAGEPWGASKLHIRKIGAVPARSTYQVTAWCRGASPIRYILGNVVDGAIVADTETQIDCHSAPVRGGSLDVPQPNGSLVYLAAEPGTQVSLLLTSPAPPIAVAQSEPGWRMSDSIGPDLAFESHPVSMRGVGVGEDHVRVVLECSGYDPIEVVVEDGAHIGSHSQTFDAVCTPDGDTTSATFKVPEQGVNVRYVAPTYSWTALSILVPSK